MRCRYPGPPRQPPLPLLERFHTTLPLVVLPSWERMALPGLSILALGGVLGWDSVVVLAVEEVAAEVAAAVGGEPTDMGGR